MKMLILIYIIISILLLWFWCIQFLRLMQMKSEDFASREDKTIWAVALFVLNALGAFLFWIKFRPEPDEFSSALSEELKRIDDNTYEEAKTKFPNHKEEVDEALQLPSYERTSLEQYFGKKSPSVLLKKYRKGPSDMRPGCYGILLVILTAQQVEIENS
jgi:hypothetical protein